MYRSITNYHLEQIKKTNKFYNENIDKDKEFWGNVRFEEIEQEENSEIEELLNIISKMYVNGGVLFKTILLNSIKSIPMFYFLEETTFIMKFFESDQVAKIISEFGLKEKLIYNPDFDLISENEFIEIIEKVIQNGGAYKNGLIYNEKHRQIVMKFIDNMKLSKENNKIFYSQKSWNNFFYDVAWDYTFIFIDKEKLLVHVLAFTDTD